MRLRHTLSEHRREWQQRIQAVLYHHGCPRRTGLMTVDGRAWLAAQPLPAQAREQVSVALSMIDSVDREMGPLEKELRAMPADNRGARR